MTITIPMRLPSLNEFIEACKIQRGKWNKGNQMKPYTKEKAEAIARQLKENGKYFHYEPIITKTTNNDDGSITVEQSFIPVLEDIKNDKKRAK